MANRMIPRSYLAISVQVHSPPGGLQTNSVIPSPDPTNPTRYWGHWGALQPFQRECIQDAPGQMIEAISSLVRCSFLCWFTMDLLNTQGLPGAAAEVAGVIMMMMTGEEEREHEGRRQISRKGRGGSAGMEEKEGEQGEKRRVSRTGRGG